MRIALYVSRYAEQEDIQTPPSLQYLAGYLIEKGVVKKDDLLFAKNAEEIIAFSPDIMGVGSVSQSFRDAVDMAGKIRSELPDCFNILGGYHISALPQSLPKDFDVGVIGEGEITLAELVSMKAKLGSIDYEHLPSIKGICYRNERDEIVKTSKRSLIENIDSMPLPFRRLPHGQEWAYLFTARGCPYSCMYCASHKFWGAYRFHSAEYIVNEIGRLVEGFGVSSIYFVDDLFIAPKKRLKKIKQLLESRNWLGKIRFKGFIRVNLVDEETIRILKDIGFVEVRFGMETASQRLLPLIKDHPFTVEQAENAIELCNKVKLPVCASFMFGIPGEEENDINDSINFLRKHRGKFYISGFYLMQPVPGSKLWDESLLKGKIKSDLDFSSLELDLNRVDFNWDCVTYLNADKISLPRFKEIMDGIRKEFIGPAKHKRIYNLAKKALNTTIQKIYFFVKTAFQKAGFDIVRIQTEQVKSQRVTNREIIKSARLYVGCGEETKEGFIGCDIRPLPNVSIVCEAWNISRYCIEVKEIYTRHMIEHLTLPQVEATLSDWMRALAVGGTVCILVPNMDYHIEQWHRAVWDEENWDKTFSDARHAFAGFWGWQRESSVKSIINDKTSAFWDVHKCGFNKKFLTFMLVRAGFDDVDCEVVNEVHLVGRGCKKR